MAYSPSIILNNVTSCYLPPKVAPINLSFGQHKYGIVGKNGIGKTTLLKLILDEITPNSGSIQIIGNLIYVPQLQAAHYDNATTIVDVLNATDILKSIANIHSGSYDASDFEKIGNNWDIEARILRALNQFELNNLDITSHFNKLSSGQKIKVLLSKTLIFPADFILLDEPTNNLDRDSRTILYQYLANSNRGIIAISHDRTLLNFCDHIIEITPGEIFGYGGNYDFYMQQKETHKNATENLVQSRTEQLKKSRLLVQSRLERHQKSTSQGIHEKRRQIKNKGNYDKIEIKSKQGRSEKTNRRIRLQADRKLESVNTELLEAKSKLERKNDLSIYLEKTHVPTNKIMIEIQNLSFSYSQDESLIQNFNLKVVGPERIAITGKNGTGKSTLVQLILNNLTPTHGHITLGTKHIAYLDQSVSFLRTDLTIIENFLQLNPESKPFDAYSALACFGFRNNDAEKKIKNLSGGEKMRAGLGIALMSPNPPQLIILDEPTNHLDFETIEAIEQALKVYQGMILAISHDDIFLENIGINRYVCL